MAQTTDKEINALIQAANKRLRDTCSHLEWRYCKEDGEYEIGIANDLEGTYEAYCIGYGADEIPDLIPDAEKWARTDHAPEEVQVMRKTKRQKLFQMVMELTNQQAAEVIAFIKENIKC